MPFNVTMEDGTTINDVPDGTTKSQLMAKYQKASPPPLTNPVPDEVPRNEQMRPAAILDGKTPPQQPGFMERVGQDVQKRVGMAQDIKGRAGAQPIGETALQAVGGVGAGLMGDVAGEVAKSAYGALPDKARAAIESNPVVKMGVSMAQKGADIYGKWAQQNPRAARDVEAAVNIASLFPIGKAAGMAGKAAGEVSAISPIAKGVMAPSVEKMAKITDTMHKTATSTIEKAKNAGVVFHPDEGASIISELDKHPDLTTAGEQSTRPMTVNAISDLTKSIDKGDTSLKNLLGFRDKLTEIARKGGQDGEAARKARAVLDKSIDTGKVVAGDDKAVKLVKDFRSQWGRYKTGEAVADAAALASESPAKSRKAFQKIVDSSYFKSLSPEVQRLTKLAAKGKASGKFLDAIGSLKNILGATVGKHLPMMEAGAAVLSGHPGVAAGIGGVLAAGKAGKTIQRGVGADVLRALQENK